MNSGTADVGICDIDSATCNKNWESIEDAWSPEENLNSVPAREKKDLNTDVSEYGPDIG